MQLGSLGTESPVTHLHTCRIWEGDTNIILACVRNVESDTRQHKIKKLYYIPIVREGGGKGRTIRHYV